MLYYPDNAAPEAGEEEEQHHQLNNPYPTHQTTNRPMIAHENADVDVGVQTGGSASAQANADMHVETPATTDVDAGDLVDADVETSERVNKMTHRTHRTTPEPKSKPAHA